VSSSFDGRLSVATRSQNDRPIVHWICHSSRHHGCRSDGTSYHSTRQVALGLSLDGPSCPNGRLRRATRVLGTRRLTARSRAITSIPRAGGRNHRPGAVGRI